MFQTAMITEALLIFLRNSLIRQNIFTNHLIYAHYDKKR